MNRKSPNPHPWSIFNFINIECNFAGLDFPAADAAAAVGNSISFRERYCFEIDSFLMAMAMAIEIDSLHF